MTFGELLNAANESRTGRKVGQWTPAACKTWREAEPEDARLLEAAIAWELATGIKARSDDEEAVCAYLRAMEDSTTAIKKSLQKKLLIHLKKDIDFSVNPTYL